MGVGTVSQALGGIASGRDGEKGGAGAVVVFSGTRAVRGLHREGKYNLPDRSFYLPFRCRAYVSIVFPTYHTFRLHHIIEHSLTNSTQVPIILANSLHSTRRAAGSTKDCLHLGDTRDPSLVALL